MIRHLEDWAKDRRQQHINAADIFNSKPNLRVIYPSATGVVTEFEPHAGAAHKYAFVYWKQLEIGGAGHDNC
jgi:hypothetical protein